MTNEVRGFVVWASILSFIVAVVLALLSVSGQIVMALVIVFFGLQALAIFFPGVDQDK